MSHFFNTLKNPNLVTLLIQGKIGVVKTDTIYGLVASASSEQAVERLYKVRGRDKDKPSIILISSIDHLYDQTGYNLAKPYWPGKVSVILPATKAPRYLTRGGETLAYRWPDDPELEWLLRKTGPLIAPSANMQGQPPAKNISEAKEYFGENIDFYVDGGEVKDQTPSRLLKIDESGKAKWLR